jgi:hypothetical protein
MIPPRRAQKNPVAFLRALGAVVVAHRRRLKLTRADLAVLSGLPEASVACVEDGDLRADFLQLVAIALAMDVPLRTLVARAERRLRTKRRGKTLKSRGKGRKCGTAL